MCCAVLRTEEKTEMEILRRQISRSTEELLFVQSDKRVGQILLELHKKGSYLVTEISFDRSISPNEREEAMLAFCEKMQQEKILLLLGCRAAQNWFQAHPEQSKLLASKVKTKPGF